MTNGDSPRAGRAPLFLLAAVAAAVAAYLAWLVSRDYSLWLDESLSAGIQDLSWSELWRVVTERDTNMALYLVLLKAWTRGTNDPAIMRAFSVVFAVGTLPVVYALGRMLRDATTGVIAAAVMGANAFFLVHGQEVRGYALVLFLVSVGSLLFFRGVERPRAATFVWYTLVSAAAVYVSLYALFVVAGHAAAALVRHDRARLLRYVAGSVAAVGVLIAPLAAFIATAGVDQMSWDEVPSPSQLVRAVASILGGQGLKVGIPLLALFALAGAAALWGAWRAAWRDAGWGRVALAAWAGAPILGGFTISQVTPIFEERYLIVALPPLCLLLALGVTGRLGERSNKAGYGVLAAVLALSLYQAAQPALPRNDERWDEVAAYVLGEVELGDGIAFASATTRLAFAYEARAEPFGAAPEALTPDYDWSWADAREALATGSGPVFQAVEPGVTPAAVATHDRVWLVLSHEEAEPVETEALIEAISGAMDLTEERTFGSIEVRLYGGA